MSDTALVGIGLYTPAEAARLINVAPSKIIRWLRGYVAKGAEYARLWRPQVELLDDDRVYLGFRDLMEARVANAFIRDGILSAQKVRRAIEIARDMVGEEHPLSTMRFQTDGRRVFLQLGEEEEDARVIDLFRQQFAFRELIEPSLRHIEFDIGGRPSRWYPKGKTAGIVVDPKYSFGRPIEVTSGIPSQILAAAASAEGSIQAAARAWRVRPAAIRHAVAFERGLPALKAA